jgi:hypothetical protein
MKRIKTNNPIIKEVIPPMITETITTSPQKDHYRNIPSQNFFAFPKGFNPKEWTIRRYAQGDRFLRKRCVTLDLFDTFTFDKFTMNEKGKEQFMQVRAHRIKERSVWVLILEKKPIKVDKWKVGEDMICPRTKKHCDDECCPIGATCNLKGVEEILKNQ